MPIAVTATALATLIPVWASAFQVAAVYKWVEKDGVHHYGDTVPPEYSEVEKRRPDDSAFSATYQTVDEFIIHREYVSNF